MDTLFQIFAPPKDLQPFVAQYFNILKEGTVENSVPVITRGLPAWLLILQPGNQGSVKYYRPFQQTMNYHKFYVFGQTTEPTKQKTL
jgi:hypothetical protein